MVFMERKADYGSHDFVVLCYLAQEKHSTERNIKVVLGLESTDSKMLFGSLLRDRLVARIEPGVLSITERGMQKYIEFNQERGQEPVA